jgi:hypothetical protein
MDQFFDLFFVWIGDFFDRLLACSRSAWLLITLFQWIHKVLFISRLRTSLGFNLIPLKIVRALCLGLVLYFV